MSEFSWWFYYKHYTECFCHIKKCVAFRHDIKMSESELYALNFIDGLMRENSYIFAVLSGIMSAAFVSGFVGLNLRSDSNKTWIVCKVAFGGLAMWNINKIMDFGSHVGMMFSLPRIFLILDEGFSEKSLIRLETQKFIEELRQELPLESKN